MDEENDFCFCLKVEVVFVVFDERGIGVYEGLDEEVFLDELCVGVVVKNCIVLLHFFIICSIANQALHYFNKQPILFILKCIHKCLLDICTVFLNILKPYRRVDYFLIDIP
jgi:hypothetical protein